MYIRTNRALVWTDQASCPKGDAPHLSGTSQLTSSNTTTKHSGAQPSAEPRQSQLASRHHDGVGESAGHYVLLGSVSSLTWGTM